MAHHDAQEARDRPSHGSTQSTAGVFPPAGAKHGHDVGSISAQKRAHPTLPPLRQANLSRVLVDGIKLPTGYEECHPVHGFLWAQSQLAENCYKYTDPKTGIGALMRLLFYRTEAVEFSPTRHAKMAAAYLAPSTIGQLVAQMASGGGSHRKFRGIMQACCDMRRRQAEAYAAFVELSQLVDVAVETFSRRRLRQQQHTAQLSHLRQEKRQAQQRVSQARGRVFKELSASAKAAVDANYEKVAALREAGHEPFMKAGQSEASAWISFGAAKDLLDTHRRTLIRNDLQHKPSVFEALAKAEARLLFVSETYHAERELAALNKKGYRAQVAEAARARGLQMAPLDAICSLDVPGPKFPARLRNALAKRRPAVEDAYAQAQDELARALFGAMQEEGGSRALAVRALLAFLWRSFSDSASLNQFVLGVQHIAMGSPKSRPSCALDVAGIMARHGAQVAGGFFPPLCMTAVSRASEESVIFPDCGESTLRNFFNVLLHREGRFEADRLRASGLQVHPKLLFFYETHNLAAEASGQAAHNAWAWVTSDLNGKHPPFIRYLSPARHPTCEIDAGGRNSLQLMRALVGTDDIGRISHSLVGRAHPEFVCDLSCFRPDQSAVVDWSNKIALKFGEHVFEWCFLVRHFRCRVLGPDQKKQAVAKDAVLARIRAAPQAGPLGGQGVSDFILGLQTADVQEVVAAACRTYFSSAHLAELVFAADLRSIDAQYRAVLMLLDQPGWTECPFLRRCLGAMALALPRHPDHLVKRAHIARLIRLRPVPSLMDLAEELSQMDNASWVDTRSED